MIPFTLTHKANCPILTPPKSELLINSIKGRLSDPNIIKDTETEVVYLLDQLKLDVFLKSHNIKELKAKKNIDGLIDATLYEEDWQIRYNAIEALSYFPSERRAVGALFLCLSDYEEEVRIKAAIILGAIDNERAILYLALSFEKQGCRAVRKEILRAILKQVDTGSLEYRSNVERIGLLKRGVSAPLLRALGEYKSISANLDALLKDDRAYDIVSKYLKSIILMLLRKEEAISIEYKDLKGTPVQEGEIKKVLILYSIEGEEMDRRLEIMRNSPQFKKYTICSVVALSAAAKSAVVLSADVLSADNKYSFSDSYKLRKKEYLEDSLFDTINEKIKSFKPDVLLLHTGTIFESYPKVFIDTFAKLKRLHPKLRLGTESLRCGLNYYAEYLFDLSRQMRDIEALFFQYELRHNYYPR